MLNSHFLPIEAHPYLARRALDEANLMAVLIENRRHHPLSRMLTPAIEHRIARLRKRPIGEWWNIIPPETTHLRDEPGTAPHTFELDLGDIVLSPVGLAGMLTKERVREIHVAMLLAGMSRLEQLRHRPIH